MNIKCLQRPCPVCRNATGELLHTQKFILPDNHILPSQYDVVACDNCGFVFADSPASQDAYDKYYAEMSRYDMNYTCADSSLYIDRAAWVNTFIRNRTDSIIDVGCGNGQLLLELKKLGLSDLTGLDPSEKCVSDLKNKGFCGIASSIFSTSASRKYDGAVLSGVLEHIYDVGKVMEAMKQLLKCRGLLFVCVPDASRYQDYDAVPYDYFNIEHINHFDETSLLNLGLQHGFSVIGLHKTTITLSQTTQPMVFCTYCNEDKAPANWRNYSAKMVLEYIAHTQKDQTVNLIIDKLAESGEEIVIWGAGNYTNRLLATSSLGKCNIVMLVDKDKHKQGTCVGGKQVCSPEVLLNMRNIPAILVAAAVFSDEIVSEIRRMELSNKVIILK